MSEYHLRVRFLSPARRWAGQYVPPKEIETDEQAIEWANEKALMHRGYEVALFKGYFVIHWPFGKENQFDEPLALNLKDRELAVNLKDRE